MKKPEPPPSRPADFMLPSVGKLEQWQELNKLIYKANARYLCWDKFKYQPVPDWIKVEDAWHYLKIVRQAQLRPTPIIDAQRHLFMYWLPETAQRQLHEIDKQAAGSISAQPGILVSVNRDKYLVSSLMNEAIASSQIEGAATTRRVAKEMLRTGREPQNRAEQMIINNYRTITGLRHKLKEPLSPAMLNELHISMTEGTLKDPSAAGRYRKQEEDIVVQDQGQILHIPPPAKTLNNEITRLCSFANNDEDEFVHPVVKGILLHFWIGFLHPYVDGNGRTARAVFYWYMLSRGYWLFEFLSISEFILRRRAQYDYSYLYAETDDLDATYFVMFNLDTIVRSLNGLHEYLAIKQQEVLEISGILGEKSGLNNRQQAILRRALYQNDAEFTIESHKNSHKIAFATARADLLRLSDLGLLVKSKTGRRYIFTVPHDIKQRLGMGK